MDTHDIDTDDTGLPIPGHEHDPPRSQALEEQPPFTPEESKRFLEQMQLLAGEKRARDEALADEREAARAWLSPNMRRILSEIDANVADLSRVDCAPVADAMCRIAEIMDGLGTQEPAPVVNQTLTAKGDLVERLLLVYLRAARAPFSDETKELPGPRTGLRAVIVELAAMGGDDALLHSDDIARAWNDDTSPFSPKVRVFRAVSTKVSPILAAHAATIAEQARELARVGGLLEDYKLMATSSDPRVVRARNAALKQCNIDRDKLKHEHAAAIDEIERLKAEAEATARRVRILEIAPKAAWWANDKLGCGVLITDADNAVWVIAGAGANASNDWAKAVLEYAAKEGLT